MKKSVSVLLVLFISLFAFASGLDSFEIGTGNDLFGLAVNDNYDDQLSFNGYIKAGFEDFDLTLVLDSYTQRYTNRIDVGLLTASKEYSKDNFRFVPQVGLAFVGNLKMEYAQNFIHLIGDFPFVNIEYDDFSKILPVASIHAEYDYNLSDSLAAFAEIDSSNVLGLYYNQTLKAGLKLSDVLSAGAGYRYYKVEEGKSDTLDNFENYNNGPITFLSIDTGFVSYRNYAVLNEGFGFGTIAVDFGAIKKKASFDTEKSALKLGFVSLSLGEDMPGYKYVSFSQKVSDKISIYVEDMFDAGCGVLIQADKDHVDNHGLPRNNRQYCFVTSGISYDFGKTGYVRPSAQLGTGFYYVNLQQIKYDGTGNYQSIEPIDGARGTALVFDGRIVVDVFPAGLLKVVNNDVNVSLFAGSYVMPQHEKMETSLEKDGSNCTVNFFVPYCGLALRLGIDY